MVEISTTQGTQTILGFQKNFGVLNKGRIVKKSSTLFDIENRHFKVKFFFSILDKVGISIFLDALSKKKIVKKPGGIHDLGNCHFKGLCIFFAI